jgi:hypothetical protein
MRTQIARGLGASYHDLALPRTCLNVASVKGMFSGTYLEQDI